MIKKTSLILVLALPLSTWAHDGSNDPYIQGKILGKSLLIECNFSISCVYNRIVTEDYNKEGIWKELEVRQYLKARTQVGACRKMNICNNQDLVMLRECENLPDVKEYMVEMKTCLSKYYDPRTTNSNDNYNACMLSKTESLAHRNLVAALQIYGTKGDAHAYSVLMASSNKAQLKKVKMCLKKFLPR